MSSENGEDTLSPLLSLRGSLRRIKSAPKNSLQWPSPPKLVPPPEPDVKKTPGGAGVNLTGGSSESNHGKSARPAKDHQLDEIMTQPRPIREKEKIKQTLQTAPSRGTPEKTTTDQNNSAEDTTPRQPPQSPPGSEEKVLVLENEVKRLRKALFLQQKQREAEAKIEAEWEKEKRPRKNKSQRSSSSNKKQQEQQQPPRVKVLQKKHSDSKHSKRALENFERQKQLEQQYWIKLLGGLGILILLLLAVVRYSAAGVSSKSFTGSDASTAGSTDGQPVVAPKNYLPNDLVWVKTHDRGWRLAKVANTQTEDVQNKKAGVILMVHLLSSNSNSGGGGGGGDGDSGMPSEPHYMAFRVGNQTKSVHPALLADRSSFKAFGLIIPILSSDAVRNNDASLAEETCLSLGDLARSSLHRAAIHGTVGALAAVVRTLSLFQDSESLQKACILALGNLAHADSATIKELKKTGESTETFCLIMFCFSGD